MVLAGPGVVHAGAIAELRGLAVAGNLGVLNSWGAKGVFHWRSRHHLATVGLQAQDVELSGVPEADLLICVGVDSAETDASSWRVVPVVDLPIAAMAPLSELWARPRGEIPVPALRHRLAAVTQWGWEVTGAPLAPTQVTRNYAGIVAAGGVVVADPGLAGFWVARTLGTTRSGAVQVPATSHGDGLAVARAIVARQLWPDTPVLAAVDSLGPLAMELIATYPLVAVEVWDQQGPALDLHGHERRLHRLLASGGVAHVTARTDQLPMIVEAAGPITAWGGMVHS
jgi:thiamine pyrophosphate-dependent acetolactate synthase large subunit-like protein